MRGRGRERAAGEAGAAPPGAPGGEAGGGPRPGRWSLRGFVRSYLSPADRLAETLCGLIMVLTFTLVAGKGFREGEGGVRTLLLATLGCNLAWGIIDGVLYVLSAVSQRAHRARFLETLRTLPEDRAAALVLPAMEEKLPLTGSAEERERASRILAPLLAKIAPEPVRLSADDLYGGLAILAVEVTCTLPAALPFLFVRDRWTALRISNGLLLLLLFAVGHTWGRTTTGRPWGSGLAMLLLGALLVGAALALGG